MTNIIHRAWLGPKPMPEPYVEYGKMWQSMNPDWQYIEWDMKRIENYLLPHIKNKKVWDSIGGRPASSITMDNDRAIAVQRADVLGYEILNLFGGMYFNCDIEPLRPMDELLEVVGEKSWAPYEDNEHLVNCAMGGPKGSGVWRYAVKYLPLRYFGNFNSTMEFTTGPHLVTAIYRSNTFPDEFMALPRETFNYAHFGSINVGGDASAYREAAIEAGAFGLHHWGHRQDQINYIEE